MARPSKFKPEFIPQAEKLAKLGATDVEIADFFEVDLSAIAEWAWFSEDFYRAITPSAETRRAWDAERAARRAPINERRRASLAANAGKRVLNALRARVWAALRGRTDGALFGRLGYSLDELVQHLESRFTPGMTWENYGAWHVDHKKPCASFDQTDPEQFAACWALSNLEPLWAGDNFKKGAKYAGA